MWKINKQITSTRATDDVCEEAEKKFVEKIYKNFAWMFLLIFSCMLDSHFVFVSFVGVRLHVEIFPAARNSKPFLQQSFDKVSF